MGGSGGRGIGGRLGDAFRGRPPGPVGMPGLAGWAFAAGVAGLLGWALADRGRLHEVSTKVPNGSYVRRNGTINWVAAKEQLSNLEYNRLRSAYYRAVKIVRATTP